MNRVGSDNRQGKLQKVEFYKMKKGDKVKVNQGGLNGYGVVIDILHNDYVSVRMDDGRVIPYIFVSYLEVQDEVRQ